MSDLYIILDSAMCASWIIAYTLVLIGTVRYQYPLISPITQAIIAPFEFSVAIFWLVIAKVQFNYAVVAYVYWSMIEILIILVILKNRWLKKKYVALYIISVLTITAIMVYLVAIKEHMLFFSYLNTFIGEVIWLRHTLKRNYPMKPISLAIFIAKFIADVLGAIVYYGGGSWLVKVFAVLLPILDLVFIFAYFQRLIPKKCLS